jgi:hypothetical protein
MTSFRILFQRSRLPVLLVLCILALTATAVFADDTLRPPAAVTIIGSPDAAVTGKFAVGTASPGSKALTVTGVIDFKGAGTVSNYFTQGPGNNMQIRSNVDEVNSVFDASKSQWNMVMGAAMDEFSIRRSPPGTPYNEDALFWIDGGTGRTGVGVFDTANGANSIPTPLGQFYVLSSGNVSAVMGQITSTVGGDFAVWGKNYQTDGFGVLGWAAATTGDPYGVWGYNDADDGIAVFGQADHSTGANFGVYGLTDSSSGYGVAGFELGASVSDVSGWAESGGVFGSNTGNGLIGVTKGSNMIAVVGENLATTGYGVYGTGGTYAGYFSGNVRVAGTLSKSAGSFIIDHPLDPENMYLQHSFVESPDMMNIYNGNVKLNENGEAWVELPDWFEALNMDFRYQLTPIGEFAPLYIASEISGNRFQIAGGAPGMKVSWQVTGIRHDPYAEANRIEVEVEKSVDGLGAPLSDGALGVGQESGVFNPPDLDRSPEP